VHHGRGLKTQAQAWFQSAVEVNPNLDGPAQMIPLPEQHL